jgi:hypothetical protein
MDSTEVYAVMKNTFKRMKCTYDVLACDELDIFAVTKYPICLCVNNQTKAEAGEHWLGIYIPKSKGPMNFFCSFGLGIDSYAPNFKNFAIKLKINVVENKICLQSMTSNVCGLYVIHFLYKRLCGYRLMSIYCGFSKNMKRNDLIVRRLLLYNRYLFKNKYCNHTRK